MAGRKSRSCARPARQPRGHPGRAVRVLRRPHNGGPVTLTVTAKRKRPRAESPPSAKQPVATSEIPSGKRVSRPPTGDRSGELLSWRLSTLDLDGPWGWQRVAEAALRQLHDKLRGFETMTAGELFGPNRGHKHISVESLPREAFRRLQQLELDDVDGLCELRIRGAARVWGFRRGNIIHLLWWDPDHTVFPGNR